MSILKKVFTCICCITFSVMIVAATGCETEQQRNEAEMEEALEEFGEALEDALEEMENIEFDE